MNEQEPDLVLAAAFREALRRLAGELIGGTSDETGKALLRVGLAIPKALEGAARRLDPFMDQRIRTAKAAGDAQHGLCQGRGPAVRCDRDVEADKFRSDPGKGPFDACRMM